MPGNILNKQGFGIPTIIIDGEDYLSLTFMCKDVDYKPKDKIRNYLSDPAKLRYVFALERAMNPSFRYAITKDGYIVNSTDPDVEIGGPLTAPLSLINGQSKVRVESLITMYGLHSLYLKKGGRNSGQGIYAHHLIALHFATWLDAEYGLYVNWDYERLKTIELDKQVMEVGWFYDRDDAKLSHRLLENLVIQVCIPATEKDASVVFTAEEKKTILEDIMISLSEYVNIKVFGQTSIEWRQKNPNKPGNMRDYATKVQLLTVAHLERSVCAVIAEYPLDQKKWMSAIEREASDHMTRLDKLNRYSGGKAFDESLSIGSIPNGYDSRTISARESASAKFKEDLLTGKIHYDSSDDVFRDMDGFIRLGWKI